jgi:membrane protein YqaA with SNARE-associated domain
VLEDIVGAVRDALHEIASNPFFVKYGLAGLFANGLLASTILPIPIEITTSAILAAGYDRLLVYAVLVSSTVAGGFLNYYLGRSGDTLFGFLRGRPKKEDEQKGEDMLRKYGWVAFLIAPWVPAVGDLVPIVAGVRRYDLKKFAIAMSAGKAARTVATVYISGVLAGSLFG